jgi:type II secretory pathway pseudopilin PulG
MKRGAATSGVTRAGRRRRLGFTLAETAVAVGIVAFALVVILGFVSVALKTSRETQELQGAVGLRAPLADFLKTQGFTAMFNVATTGTQVVGYAYKDDNGSWTSRVRDKSVATGETEQLARRGRLYRIDLALSNNPPFTQTSGSLRGGGYTTATYPEAALPFQAKIYPATAVSGTAVAVSATNPILTYEVLVFR